ncbi:hypothetical protein Taro_028827 [Colocasia esculenta]|uniref:WPP domain-associated protein n=1 Tax=Colocasia esculenta TaxID=4460 RepID=A0A843VT22_COLES|nr:hypothetical protein [Colocasia esculenta]
MPNLETAESSAALMDDESILSTSSFKGSENLCADSISNENLLLEDWESYWNDLNARLTVSRMVSDSVIRGIVNAVVQEAAESNSSKEAEITRLTKRLALYEPDTLAGKESILSPVPAETTSHMLFNCSDLIKDNTRHLFHLNIAAEKHLQLLKSGIECIRKMINSGSENCLCCVSDHLKAAGDLTQIDKSIDALGLLVTSISQQIDGMTHTLKDSLYEQQWQWEFQREVDSIIFQASIREQREEFDMELCKQKSLFDAQNHFWFQKVQELSSLHQELDSISKSILGIEPEHPFSHGPQEIFEERTSNKMKDQFPHKVYRDNIAVDTSHIGVNGFATMEKSDIPSLGVPEASLLVHMSKEDLMSHYQNEINKIKRQLEAALHEKTEELFRLKREFLKERGSLHFRRDKDVESLKKKVPEVVLKLDKVLAESKNFSSVQDHHDKTCTFKQRIENLLAENRRLHDLLVDKRKEMDCLSSQVTDAAKQRSNYSIVEANLFKKVKKLEWEIEDVKTEAIIKGQLDEWIVSELIRDAKCQAEELLLKDMMVEEFYGCIFRGSIADVYSSMKPVVKYDEEKKTLATIVSEKEKAWDLEVEKSGKLRQEVVSLMALINEKESALLLEVTKSEKLSQEIKSLSSLIEEENHFVSDINAKLEQQNKHLDLCCEELNLLKDQANDRRRLISEDKSESNLLRAKLEEALNKIQQSDAKIAELNERLAIVSDDIKEAEKQKAHLHDMVQQKESEIVSVSVQMDEQTEQMESIVIFVQELSKSVQEFESIVMCNFERRSARLEILCHQLDTLIKHADILKIRELWYRKRLETRTSDLEKAETEVDLLGDEVDALLNILEKIYIALDHYSPILQHYPGVMEILKLVRRELKGSG